MNVLVKVPNDPWQICSGHDLTTLLALHLSRVTGLQVTRRTVEAGLAGRFQAIGAVFPQKIEADNGKQHRRSRK